MWEAPPQPRQPAPPSVPAPNVPVDAPVKVVPSKPGFADLFASDSIDGGDDPFAEDPFGGDPFASDPFANQSCHDR